MRKGAGKAFYIFLCSILGMVLFAVFHRAIVVIYYILLDYNPNVYAFGLSMSDVQMIDFVSGMVAIFLGGWYGVWLGLHWYSTVYETEHRPGLFHGFIPHYWRRAQRIARKELRRVATVQQVAQTPKTIHVPVKQRTSEFEHFKTPSSEVVDRSILPWNFDDLSEQVIDKKKSAKRKRTAAKAVKPRKAAARKTTASKKVKEEVTV